jgi:hypothetical protein
MSADHGDAVDLGGPANARQRLPGHRLRADQGVDDGQRPSAHGGHVVDVGEDGGDARAQGVALHEGRVDGLAGDQQVAVVERQDGGVVARAAKPVPRPQHLGHQAQRALGPQRRRLAHLTGDPVDLGTIRGLLHSGIV